MVVKLESTGVRFPDNSIQTAAAITSTTFGGVGTYALMSLIYYVQDSVAEGASKAGSALRFASLTLSGSVVISSTVPAGTWKNMGTSIETDPYGCTTPAACTLFLRIA